jgi:hypothetical protein
VFVIVPRSTTKPSRVAVREAQRLSCVAQLEADPGGKIKLFSKRDRIAL